MIYEYGAMTSKYSLEAENKLTAYVAMVAHFNQSAHLIAIYEPESSKKDSWLCFDGKISSRLDEIFGGENSFDKYSEKHLLEIRECLKTIKQIT